jgi:dihydrofolate reductase
LLDDFSQEFVYVVCCIISVNQQKIELLFYEQNQSSCIFHFIGWLLPTRRFQQMIGKANGTLGIDNDFAERSFENIGAWIMGRNMFGPVRGPWPDEEWKGCITDGIEAALEGPGRQQKEKASA